MSTMSTGLRRFYAVFRARNMEFWRDRAALGWNFLLPTLVVLAFAFGFTGDEQASYNVGLLGETPADAAPVFMKTRYIRFIPVPDVDGGLTRLRQQRLDMLLDPGAGRFWVNEASGKGYLLERILGGVSERDWTRATVSGRRLRYVDWLIPGILGMNIMFSALWGVGYVVVRYRKNGVLKRLKATPLSAFEFLGAQIVSRLWVILGVLLILFTGTRLVVGFSMLGSYLDLFIIFVLGAISLISLSLMVAARVTSEELADGILNLISWPMMFLSGVWFATEDLHPGVQALAQVFPLTHLISGARAIMLDGAGLADVSAQVVTLLAMSVVFMVAGSLSFRWE